MVNVYVLPRYNIMSFNRIQQAYVGLAGTSRTGTRSQAQIETVVSLAGRSATGTRSAATLDTGITLAGRSATGTRTVSVVSTVVGIEGRSATATRAGLELDTEISLAGVSRTATRSKAGIHVVRLLEGYVQLLTARFDTIQYLVADPEPQILLQALVNPRGYFKARIKSATQQDGAVWKDSDIELVFVLDSNAEGISAAWKLALGPDDTPLIVKATNDGIYTEGNMLCVVLDAANTKNITSGEYYHELRGRGAWGYTMLFACGELVLREVLTAKDDLV